MFKNVYRRIKKRRKELGLKDTYVASQIDQTIDTYWDIEHDKTEIFAVIYLKTIKDLCKILSVGFFELFGLKCEFCQKGKPFDEDYLLPRNKLIRKRREALGISREELGNRLGFLEIAIVDMEKDPDYLDGWCIDYIKNVRKELKIPLQILLGEKCGICKR